MRFIKIIFVRSKENKSDGLTKNVNADIYDAQREHVVYTKEEYTMLKGGKDEDDFSSNEGRVLDS